MAPLLHSCLYHGYLPWKILIVVVETPVAPSVFKFSKFISWFIAPNFKSVTRQILDQCTKSMTIQSILMLFNDKGSCQTLCSGLFSAKNIISAVLCKNQQGVLQTFFHGNFSITLNFSLILKSKWRWDENFNIF